VCLLKFKLHLYLLSKSVPTSMLGRRFGVMCAFPFMVKSGVLSHGIIISISISPIAKVTPPPTPITRNFNCYMSLLLSFAKYGLINITGLPKSRHMGLAFNPSRIDTCTIACKGTVV